LDRPGLDQFIARALDAHRRDQLDVAAVAVLDAFESAGIEALLLNGAALDRRLYAEGESRGYWDIDLLVAPRDLGRAMDVLSALGFKRAVAPHTDDTGRTQHGESWTRMDQGGAVWIDLHWRLDGCDAPGDVIWSALEATRGSIDLHGRKTAIPGDGGLALHLALHAAHHGRDGAKAMGDLARGVERWPLGVWRSAARLAEAMQGIPAFAAGLRLQPEGAEIATELGLPPTAELDWEIRHRSARPRGTFHLRAISNAGGVRERLSVLRRSLLPTRAWILWEFPWAARRRPLLAVAYLLHVLRAPLWAGRAVTFRWRARRAGRP
jgi:hypothetical protein